MPDGVGAWHQEAASAPASIAVATARPDSPRPGAGAARLAPRWRPPPDSPPQRRRPLWARRTTTWSSATGRCTSRRRTRSTASFSMRPTSRSGPARALLLGAAPTHPARRPRRLGGVPRAPRRGAGVGARPGASPRVPAPEWRQLRALGWAEGPGATSAGAFFLQSDSWVDPEPAPPIQHALWPV